MLHPSVGRQRGFTLAELVIVIIVGGLVAATISVFLRPAIDSWQALRLRGDLTEQAATALQVMRRDVRLAVPNSIRTPGSACFELVPTSAGGRFRMAPDPAGGSLPLDLSTPTLQFDVLTDLATSPSPGDRVVIDNQNPGEVYAVGTNNVALAAFTVVNTSTARSQITLASSFDRPGYGGGRFVIVPDAQQAVFYVCSNAGVDGQQNGTGTLTRYSRYGFVAGYPASCAAPAGATAATLATRVKSCSFVYDPNLGATQQSGFVSMQLELTRNGETVSLLSGAHVVNVP